MSTSVIVWDLETVPDIAGFAASNNLSGKSEEEIRGAIGDKFPKLIYHSIVCIGALVATREDDRWKVEVERRKTDRQHLKINRDIKCDSQLLLSLL